MYYFFLGNMMLPIPPAKMKAGIGSSNKTYTLIDDGEVNRLKNAPLETISFEFLLPSQQYPFAQYKTGFLAPAIFIEYLKKLKTDKKPFQFIVTRQMPNGRVLHFTNLSVSLENLEINESADNGLDFMVSVELKEYRTPQTLITKLVNVGTAVIGTVQGVREANNSPEPKQGTKKYTVKKGDTLWVIAKKYYGDGSKYSKIAKENNLVDPNKINIGQVLIIPKL